MPRNYLARPRSVEPRPLEERASDVLADWWRQIDRWMNEGGAEGRPRASAKFTSERLEP
jgi:hypothetical protein